MLVPFFGSKLSPREIFAFLSHCRMLPSVYASSLRMPTIFILSPLSTVYKKKAGSGSIDVVDRGAYMVEPGFVQAPLVDLYRNPHNVVFVTENLFVLLLVEPLGAMERGAGIVVDIFVHLL